MQEDTCNSACSTDGTVRVTTQEVNRDNSLESPLIRHVTRWTLTNSLLPKPSPLPESGKFPDKCFSIQGYLIPSSTTKTSQKYQKEIHVSIHSLKSWCIDRSHHGRGIYIQTSTAFYWLKEPSKDLVKVINSEDIYDKNTNEHPTTSFISQEIVHNPMRARLGLLSNIIDIFSDQKYNFVYLYAKRSSTNIHCLLRPNQRIMDRYNNATEGPLNKEPFDLNLLKKIPEFVRRNMENLHDFLPDECAFFESIREFEQQLKENQRKVVPWTEEEYIASANASEQRSGRYPWGELKPNSKIRPNRLIEIKIMESRRLHSNDMSKKSNSIIENQDSQQRFLDECTHNSAEIKVLSKSTTFSSVQMIKSIAQLSSLLVPRPIGEEGDYKKFAILDSSSRVFMDEIITNTQVPSLELMLIAVETLSRSGQKVMKATFQKNVELKKCAGYVIFKAWLGYVVKVMAGMRQSVSCHAMAKDHKRTDELVAISIMNLICNFSVITEGKQIDILKSKFDVDLYQLVEKTLSFASFYGIRNVEISCRNAKVHLDLIKDQHYSN